MARFLVQTIPNKLPELLINLSSQGPHLMGATLSTLLRAVHPGTIAMTDFRQRLRPKVLTRHLGDLWTLHVISCSDEHIVLGIRHYGSIPLILKGRTLVHVFVIVFFVESAVGSCWARLFLFPYWRLLLQVAPPFGSEVDCDGPLIHGFITNN